MATKSEATNSRAEQDSSDVLTISLEAKLPQADAVAVASTMHAITAIVEETQQQMAQSHKLLVKARPFAKGSFVIPLELIIIGGTILTEGGAPLLQQIFSVLKEYLEVRKALKGSVLPPPKK